MNPTLRSSCCLILLSVVQAAAFQANVADFPIKVRVLHSQSLPQSAEQIIDAEINGQLVELEGNSQGVLALGSYPARIASSVRAPSSHPNSYDIYQGYDLMLPDGKVRTYTVIGLGSTQSCP